MSNTASPVGPIGFSIQVGSTKLDNTYPVVSITVDKTINKIPYAKIVLHDGSPAQQAFLISNKNTFDMGSKVTIQLGYKTTLETVFEGVIVKQSIRSHGHQVPHLIIECRDAAYKTTLVPKNTSFSSMADSDILTKIIGNYSDLSKDIGSTSIQHESLSQHEVTDWDFINMRAEVNGQVIIVDDGKITSQAPKPSGSPDFTFSYGDNIYGLDLEMDARSQWQGAGGRTWDPSSQDSQDVTATDPGEQSFGNTDYSTLTGVNSQDPVMFYHSGTLAEDEMTNLATGLLTLNRVAKIRGKVTVQGIAAIKPGKTIKIDKSADNFQGVAYVSGVQHQVKAGNWVTELTIGLPNQRYMRQYPDMMGLPTAGMLTPMYGLQVGVVKKLTEDPQSLYRIFVRLPMVHKSDEGVWCRIASFYASQEAGAFFMPEVEDEVVVGFINDDFRSPVIVGSLYSSKHTPPTELDEKNSQKSFTSLSKLELIFNDTDKIITLKTPGNRTICISDKDSSIEITNGDANKIILGNDNVAISCNQDITLDAQGSIKLTATQDVVLKASNEVNISGLNVSSKADMKASLVGSTSAEVQSNATTVIKGGIVQIN